MEPEKNVSELPNTSDPTQKLAQTELEAAIAITKKIINYPISSFFTNVDDMVQYIPRSKASTALSLSTILSGLNDNKYSRIEDWKNDMNSVWNNALSSPTLPLGIYLIANELKKKFEKKTKFIPKTSEQQWEYKVRKENKKLLKLAKSFVELNCTEEEVSAAPKNKIVLKKKKQ